MAKARRVVADTGSAELDELRRQFNKLLVLLEDTTATDISTVQDAITAGTVTGVKPTPLHPQRPKDSTLVDLDASSDF